MGWGHEYRCKKCGRNGEIYCDSGMEYEQNCAEVYQNALKGSLGTDWENCVKENPLGAFDCKMEIYKCTACNFWKNDSRKNYYIRTNKRRSLKYVDATNLKELECIKEFCHTCPMCSNIMHIVHLDEERLNCNQCGAVLAIDRNQFIWD